MTNPTNPGDPDYTDEQNISPDDAETLAAEAAEAQGVDEDDDLLTTSPDPTYLSEDETVPSVGASEDELIADAATSDETADMSADEAIDQAAADARADEVFEAAEQRATADSTADLETQLDERTDDLKRVSAEYANYRRRTERERESVINNTKASVMVQLLPILDDLDLARQHGDLVDGPLKTFSDKLSATLQSLKLESFGAEGEPFDPEVHEAVQDLSAGGAQVVGTVLRKGYRVGDRVVRTAMVIIADPEGEPSSDGQ